MNHEIAKPQKLDLSVLTAEQGALFDKLKLYSQAEDQSRLERKTFAYLKGRTANALREITDKGLFVELLGAAFPETKQRWLYYCMDFAAAVDVGKNAPLKFLPDNRLLKRDEITEQEKEKVQSAIEKVTGDKGVMTVIKDHKKKLAREKAKDAPPVDAVAKEKAHQLAIEESFQSAIAKLEWVLHWKDTEFVLGSAANKKALAAICVRFGKRMKSLKKFKPAKA